MIHEELGGNVALDNVEHAREALARGDLAQALFHVSSALATEPQNASWRAILDEAIRRAPDARVFVRADEVKADFITSATRAYVHASRREWVDAFATLGEVIALRSDAAFYLWAVEWVVQPEVLDALTAEALEKRVLPPLVRMVSNLPPALDANDPRRANVDAAAQVLAALYGRHTQLVPLLLTSASVLRRQGRFDTAIELASYAFQLRGDWGGAISVACAYRDAKRVDDAVAWFRRAHSLRPDDAAALLDVGDTLLDAGRLAEAKVAYEQVLTIAPRDAWAEDSLLYLAFQSTKTEQALLALYEASATRSRAKELYFREVGDQPYFTWLPNPGDSTYFAARNVVAELTRRPPPPTGRGIDVHLQHMEAPSALRAFKLWTDARGWTAVGMRARVEGVQEPDTRFAKGQVDFTLWAFDDKVPRPNCPAPDPRVAQAIAAIARKPYSLAMWQRDAQALAAQMGPPWLNQLLFTMVQPPPLPHLDADPFAWLQKVQVAVALVVANLDAGWEGSARKRALESLVRGPVDWTVDAGIIALGWLAKNDPAIRSSVEQTFAWLESQIPKTGFTCYEYPLVNVWRNLGGHTSEQEQRLELWKKRCESQKIEFAEEKHAGLTLEDYAKLSAERDAILMRAASGPAGGLGAAAGVAGPALLGGVAKAMFGGIAGNVAGAAVGGAAASFGPQGELHALCAKYRVPVLAGGMAARVPTWDQRINADAALQKRFFALQQKYAMAGQGIAQNSHEARVAQQLKDGSFDVESAKQNAIAAQQALERGEGGDPDPVVFPGQRIARLSDYVSLVRAMQGGDFQGALRAHGLDMNAYMQVAQGWGVKLAADPMLAAKYQKMALAT